MSSYSERLTLTLPASLLDIANSIARAMDPDAGGAETYRLVEGSPTITMTTPCTPEFKAQAQYMMANPDALHAAVAADYAVRWPDLPVPTLADCQAFCAGIIPEATL